MTIASMESASENCVQGEVSVAPLICGLPDDIALLCLARVPRRYHHILRCVSKRWRDLLCSEEWLSCRRKNNLEETWIYVVARDKSNGNCCFVLDLDPVRRCWKLLQVIRSPCLGKHGIRVEALGKKLYVLGGCTWQTDATDEVHCYDASKNRWEIAASMPAARCYFVSASLNNKLYVTSGHGSNSDSPNSWNIYDSSSDCWSSLKNPMLTPDIVKFIALDGKLYTIHKTWNGLLFAGVYDPSCRRWEGMKNEIALCSCGPTVVVDGTLYMLDETKGTRLMVWQKESEDWVALGRLSLELTRPPCQLLAIGRSICVIGRGLSTVVIDVDKAAKVGGMLVCSSVGPNFACENHPISSCQTITI
ncbi:F-box/kelch-repeat protein SKIP4 [Elaeis guineensis]|uniref:F-box/kelch-repeat protein SKIP4 n=1 Tax=Elaeis guineensis var. tenera TaxID=51953 RepID=A0A6I9SBJ6_ELAGV|nr:F-box/kelch-repeat protein SKIP4 [Elaeis guineensis]XP_010940482.1 F-box/kelch-repeat protein SKIP4 [Elaeis guineensis]